MSTAGPTVVLGITKANWGGASVYIAACAQFAASQGASVQVLAGEDQTGGGHGQLASVLSSIGIPLVTIPSLRRDVGGSDWRAYLELVDSFRKLRPSVVHLNSSKMGLLGALAARYVGVPTIIFTAHGWPHREPRSFAWKTIAWIGSWLTVLFSHRVLVVSELDKRTAPAVFLRSRITCIHNGVAAHNGLPRDEARKSVHQLLPTLAKYRAWIWMNAELHVNKGVDTAIIALSEISKTNPSTALIVCGEGEERARLESLAKKYGVAERVFLAGFVTDSKRLLAAADIYIQPSRKEGLPMALLEAGAAALPVIASRTGGMPEVVTHEVTGLLVPSDSPQELAGAVVSLQGNPEPGTKLGAALAERIRTEFSQADMLARTTAYYF